MFYGKDTRQVNKTFKNVSQIIRRIIWYEFIKRYPLWPRNCIKKKKTDG